MKTTLMVCDIQPEYRKYIPFRIERFAAFLNRSVARRWNKTIYFYNGYDTLGMIREHELMDWLFEYGVTGQTLDRIEFIDKGYGFLSNLIENNENQKTICEAVRKLDSSNLHQMRINGGTVYYNDCFPIIQQNKNITFIGGGEKQCLAELCYVAKAYNCKYQFNHNFIY